MKKTGKLLIFVMLLSIILSSVCIPTVFAAETVAGTIRIDRVNEDVWGAENVCNLYVDGYSGEMAGLHHKSLFATWNDKYNGYVVSVALPVGTSKKELPTKLNSGEIILDAIGSGISNSSSAWAAATVGTVIRLSDDKKTATVVNGTGAPTPAPTATPAPTEKPTGEASAYAEKIKGTDYAIMSEILVNDEKTGVLLHRLHTIDNSFIHKNKLVNILEFSLGEKLTVELVNNGANNGQVESSLDAAKNYKKEGWTVVAATNGNWFHTTDSNLPTGSTKMVRVTFGIDVADGELLNSGFSTIEETALGGPMDGPDVFAVTYDNKALVGMPSITTKITNETLGKKINADGINRAPVANCLMVYNDRFNVYNYVNKDAYEVIIKTDGTNKFKVAGEVTGTVVKIIESGSETREPLQDGYVTITARGKGVKKINTFSIGDKISITTTIRDANGGKKEDWENVKTCVGGMIQPMKNGKANNSSLDTTSNDYPTMLIGTKEDGSVMICNITADQNAVYSGLNFNELHKFCKAVGYYNCFLLDGGGSATMITLDDGEFVERGCYSDGSIRSVVNTLLVLYKAEMKPAETEAPAETAEPGDNGKNGCGSIVSASAIACMLGAVCLTIKRGKHSKKEN